MNDNVTKSCMNANVTKSCMNANATKSCMNACIKCTQQSDVFLNLYFYQVILLSNNIFFNKLFLDY